jgi:hypothetical protein
MLTQGWRKYHYAKPFEDLTFKPEKSLTVSGRVSGLFIEKKEKEAKVGYVHVWQEQKCLQPGNRQPGKF